MERPSRVTTTQILQAIDAGSPRAVAQLLPVVYSELKRVARSLMVRLPPGNTLQPTALVHEAYIRLVGDDDPGWNSKGHFFVAAATAMRQILVDQARRKSAAKHGGDLDRLSVDDVEIAVEPRPENMLALEEALGQLESIDPRAAKVVLLRYFAGLTAEETAAMMDVSRSTVEREWRIARAILYGQLTDTGAVQGGSATRE